MAPSQMRPPVLETRSGLGIGIASPATTVLTSSTLAAPVQSFAARWLARRAGMSTLAAVAVAVANAWGRP